MKLQIGKIGTASKVQPLNIGLNKDHPLFSRLVWCSTPSSVFRQELLTGDKGFHVSFGGSEGRFNIPTRMGMGCGSTVDGGGVAWPWSPYFLRIKRDFTFVMWVEVFEAGSGYLWNVNWDGSTFWKSMGSYYDYGLTSFKVRFIDSGGDLRQADGPSGFYTGASDGLRCVAFRRNGSNCEYFRDGVYYGNASHGSSADVDWGTHEDVTVATRTTYNPGDGLKCVIPLVYLFEGQIPTGAIVELYNNPFALFGQDIGTVFAIVASGALSVSPTGIVSTEAFGTPTITAGNVNVAPTGISSGEAFGTPSVSPGNVNVAPTGIPSEEAFGTPTVSFGDIVVTGIPSEEAFGTPVITSMAYVNPTGISSEEAFGTPTVSFIISTNGIVSAEAFGTPVITTGNVNIMPSGIASAEAFGAHSITTGNVNVAPTGISSGEAFGTPSVSPGNVNVAPTGIPSGESFGAPSFIVGPVDITISGIPSAEAFGTPTITAGNVNVAPTGIPSEEAFGHPSLASFQPVYPSGISSAESFGTPAIYLEGELIAPIGISSEEAFGTPRFVFTIALPSIDSEEAFEIPTVTVIARNSFQQMMETDLNDVFFNGEEFAEPITIFYKDGSSVSTMGIFDNEYITADPDTTAEMQSRDPMVMIQTSDLTQQNFEIDYILIRGVQYKAIVPEPDGTGVTDIILHHR